MREALLLESSNRASLISKEVFEMTKVTKECFYPWPPAEGDTPIADAVALGNLVITAGQLGQNYDTGEIPADMAVQTRLALENLKTALESAGSDLSKILKINIFVTDIRLMSQMNAVYKEYFSFAANPPGRTTVEVSKLGIPGLMIELEATAYR